MDLTENVSAVAALLQFVDSHPRLCVLTGAGVSTDSGIPDYRDANGDWKRPAPVQYADFVSRKRARQHYWARSLIGWPWFQTAEPNLSHLHLAQLEISGHVTQIITQNVDRLHQRAGSNKVIDLHGRLDQIICLDCGVISPRQYFQDRLAEANEPFADLQAAIAPDGDAYIEDADFDGFDVPDCESCGGVLKPNVVFFGETIPKGRVETALAAMLDADALLVVGSSLMVYSGYRFCRVASAHGLPAVAINLGRTRADDLLELKVESQCDVALSAIVAAL